MEEKNNQFIEGGSLNPFYYNQFLEENQEQFEELKKITPEQIEDIYNMYVSRNYFYGEETEENKIWSYLVKKFDKGYLKFLSNDNRITTEIITKILSKKLNQILTDIEEEQEKEKKKDKGDGGEEDGESGKGNSSGGSPLSQSIESKLEETIDQTFEKIEKAISEAQEEQKREQEETLGYSTQASTGNAFNSTADPKTVMNLLDKVSFNGSAINDFITQTIKRFRGHFGNISRVEIEDLFNAQDIDDLDGLEVLSVIDDYPFLWSEVINVTKNLSVVVDLYIDFSGSTRNYCNLSPEYNTFKNRGSVNNVRMIDLEKVLGYHLYQNRYIADIYGFEYDPYKLDIDSFLKANTGEGTHIDNSIKLIQKTCNPSLIITDGEDTITEYSDLVYIINVSPHSAYKMMNNSGKVLQQYLEKNQILAFVDGMFMTRERLNQYVKGL